MDLKTRGARAGRLDQTNSELEQREVSNVETGPEVDVVATSDEAELLK